MRHCTSIYMDDIIVYSKTWDDHKRDLTAVLNSLLKQNFPPKCPNVLLGYQKLTTSVLPSLTFCVKIHHGAGTLLNNVLSTP